MIAPILDWAGTISILIGSFLITGKKASNPKRRRTALWIYLASNVFWIPFCIMIQAWGMLFSQIVLSLINIKGLYYCKKEIDNAIYKTKR